VSIQDVYKVLLLNVQYIKQISTFLIKSKSCELPVPGMHMSPLELAKQLVNPVNNLINYLFYFQQEHYLMNNSLSLNKHQ
jgi:hypothetical protein